MGWWLTNKDGQYQNVDTGKTKDASQFSTQNGFTASNSRRIAVRKDLLLNRIMIYIPVLLIDPSKL